MPAEVQIDPVHPRRKRPSPWPLIAATVVWLLLLVPTCFVGLSSVLLSDSGDTPAIEAIVGLFMAWPVVVLAALVGAWAAYALRRTVLVWVAVGLPLFWPLIPLAILAFSGLH